MIIRRAIFLVLLLLPLAACDNTRLVGTSDTNHIQYEKYGITRLKVGEIKIVNYVPTYQAPNFEHRLIIPPYIALRDWARHRFEAIGNIGIARIEILDASIVQKDKPVLNDGIFGAEKSVNTEFDLRMRVRIQIDSPNYIDLPYAETTVVRKIKYDEPSNFEDNRAMFEGIVVESLDTLDTAMTKTIHNKWGSIAE
jgi:hypothetical protein